MKRTICIILCLSMIFCLFACSSSEKGLTTSSTEKASKATLESADTGNLSTSTGPETSKSSEITTSKSGEKVTTVKNTISKEATESITSEKNETTTKKKRIPFNVDNLLDDGKIIRYELSREDYYKFTSNPTQSYLDEKGDNLAIYSKSNKSRKVNVEYPQKNHRGESIEGIERLGFNPPMPLFESLIDFADNSQELNDYLSSKGIKEIARTTAIVYSSAYPITIWLKTDKTSYLLMIDDVDDEGNYTYSLYSLKAFEEKYSPCTASLFFNRKVIAKNVVLHYNYADLPFVAVLKEIGAKVSWRSDTKADISINGKEYVLDTNKVSVTEKGREEIGGNIIMCLSGGTRFAEKRNKELILDSVHVGIALYIMNGYGVEIDYSDQKVKIVKRK